jgi:hypothetical protein
MSFTRISDNDIRIKKQMENQTFVGRYMLDRPGPGMNLSFLEDPQIRMQGFGANLCENYVNLESDMLGLTRKLNRDLVDINDFKKNAVISPPMSWGTSQPFVDESRASCPAWQFRDIQNDRWEFPILNPQNTGINKEFNDNIQTRILEKDNFKPTYPDLR